MKTYKSTDKNMQCKGYQYELGKTAERGGATRCGNKGFHSCKAPFDVLRYYRPADGSRYFEAEADGEVDFGNGKTDTKLASSKLTLTKEIDFPALVKAQIAYTKENAESGTSGGDFSNFAGGDFSNLASGDDSNLAGGDYSTLAGGDRSNLAGGDFSNLASGDDSNLAGGDRSNLAGGDDSNLAGGDFSNLAGGDFSNLAGGESSIMVGRNGCKAKGGKHSVIVLTEWDYREGELVPVCVKAEIVDGKRIKADTWYTLVDGEFQEVTE